MAEVIFGQAVSDFLKSASVINHVTHWLHTELIHTLLHSLFRSTVKHLVKTIVNNAQNGADVRFIGWTYLSNEHMRCLYLFT